MAWEWSPYLVDGGTRADAITGLNDGLETSLANMFAAAPPEIQAQLRIMSAYRSPERQQQLWDQALAKYGSPEAARKWVAPPGRSQHNHGTAVDLRYLGDDAKAWAHANAAAYGLQFPMSHEPWHIEPIGARGGQHSQDDGHSHNALASGGQYPSQQGPNALAPQQDQPRLVMVDMRQDPAAFRANAFAAPVAQFSTGNYLAGV